MKNRCKDCLYKKVKCVLSEKFSCKKVVDLSNWARTSTESKPAVLEKPNLSAIRALIVGPSNVSKTYYMLKILEKISKKTYS